MSQGLAKVVLAVLLIPILYGALILQSHAARSMSANRECSTCHIMWLNEFKLKNKTTLIPYDPRPVVKTGKQDVASTEDMCFSCHDGFVLDSRFMWQNGKYSHPVGDKPSAEIKIPLVEGKQIFPLNDEARCIAAPATLHMGLTGIKASHRFHAHEKCRLQHVYGLSQRTYRWSQAW